jgi:hypothetical protein
MRGTWTRRNRENRHPLATENLTAEQIARRSWAAPSYLAGGGSERDSSP